jgi:prephenate dehydrogenase
MWRDIFFSNKKNVVSAINLFIKNLKSFKKNIENLDDNTLRKKLVNSKKVRKQILNLKQDIPKPDFGRDQN